MLHKAILFLTTLILLSCEKEDPAKTVADFMSIKANGNVDIRLESGSQNKVLTTTLNKSDYSSNGEVLTINATSGSITIAVKDLDSINCTSCDLKSTDYIEMDSLKLSITAGFMYLNSLNVKHLDAKLHNSGTYHLFGSCRMSKIYLEDNAQFKGYNFVCDTTDIRNADEDSQVHTTKCLMSNCAGIGSVIYQGSPDSVYTTGSGSGTTQSY